MKKIIFSGLVLTLLIIITFSIKPEEYQEKNNEFYTTNSIQLKEAEDITNEAITTKEIEEVKESEEGSVFLINISQDDITEENYLTEEIIEEDYITEEIIEEEYQEEVEIEELEEPTIELASEEIPIEETIIEEEENQEEFILNDGIYQIKYLEKYIKEDYDKLYLQESLEDNISFWQITKIEDYYQIVSSFDNSLFLQEEKWNIIKFDNGIKFISIDNNLCLDAEDDEITLKECNKSKSSQIFLLEDNNKIKEGKYKIKSVSSNNILSLEDKTNIALLNDIEDKSQIWYISEVDDNYYQISNAKNISLTLEHLEESNNLEINVGKNKDNQKWKFVLNQDNTISIVSSQNTCITQKEDDIIIDTCDSSDNQKFVLEEYQFPLMYYGIDISSHQGDIDFQALSESEVEFVIIRAGYGDNWTSQDDLNLFRNVEGCEKYHIPYGIYLYSYAKNIEGSNELNSNSESVSSEISHILRLLDELNELGYHPNLKTKVFYDMEEDSNIYLGRETLTNMADIFCKEVEKSGYSCGIYANKYWLTNNLNASYLSKKYDIWLAEWPNNISNYEDASKISPTYQNTNYDIWQFSSQGIISGISGYVDLNLGYDIFE